MLVKKYRLTQGFTLVEISIVLIIIGLVLGGVLVGRDLVKASQIRAQISQIEKLHAAVATFRTKYNCIPGDCSQAVASGLGTSGGDGDNGDGSGAVEITAASLDGDEVRNFWYHLSESKLIAEKSSTGGTVPGINSPPLKMHGMGIQGNSTGGIWFMSERVLPSDYRAVDHYVLVTKTDGTSTSSGVYLPPDALKIDAKLDDGSAHNGRIKAGNGVLSTLEDAVAFTASDMFTLAMGTGCASGTVSTGYYYVSTSLTPSAASLCNMMIKVNF